MRVLLLPSWYPSDAQDVSGVFFRDQAIALASTGIEVTVLAPRLWSLRKIAAGRWPTCGLGPNLDCGVLTYRKNVLALLPRVPYGNALLWKKAADCLLAEHVHANGWPDLVHAHSALYAGYAAAGWKERFGLPYVMTEHRSAFARGMLASWQRTMVAKAMELADERVAVSPELGRLLLDMFPGNSSPWQWIPNVVAQRFEYRPQVKRRQGGVRFFHLALMTGNKGQADLLRAYAQAFGREAGTELIVAGDGPLLSALKALTESLEITDRVRFLGRIPPDQVPAMMSDADVFVLPSHYETFGVVAAEALMCGTPVIATRCGGPESIVGPEDGMLVSPHAPSDLAAAMQIMVRRLPEINRLAIATRAKARFSSQVVASQLKSLYQQVLHRSSYVLAATDAD